MLLIRHSHRRSLAIEAVERAIVHAHVHSHKNAHFPGRHAAEKGQARCFVRTKKPETLISQTTEAPTRTAAGFGEVNSETAGITIGRQARETVD